MAHSAPDVVGFTGVRDLSAVRDSVLVDTVGTGQGGHCQQNGQRAEKDVAAPINTLI